jgi:hypothetical protein
MDPTRLLPELVYFYPTQADSPVLVRQPQILLDWSTDIVVTQFSDPVQLAKWVTLVVKDTAINIPLSYVSYDATQKRVTLQPTSPLIYGGNYCITIRNGILDSYGRSHRVDRIWYFGVGSSGIGTPVLQLPTNYSVSTTFPSFSWSNTAPIYEFQSDSVLDFVTPIEDKILYTNFYIPITAYAADTTYYWRVRSISGVLTGDWTEPYAFYYGTVEHAHASTQIDITDLDFNLVDFGFSLESSNLTNWPAITFTFTNILGSSSIDALSIIRQAAVPRNDDPTSYQAFSVAGSSSVSGNVLTFTPTEAILQNTIYTVNLDTRVVDTTGQGLNKKLQFLFSGPYTPFYTNRFAVKQMLGTEADHTPDGKIDWAIHLKSLEANAQYEAALWLAMPVWGPEGITEATIRNPSLKSHAVMRWTTAGVIIDLLTRVLNDELRNIGRSRRLADYQETLDDSFLKGIKESIRLAQEDCDKWTAELIGASAKDSVSISQYWSPGNWYNNYSIYPW